jgi:N4-gp56 family major capsid protein
MATTQTTDVLWDQAAYEQLAYYALRAGTFYDQFATVKPTRQSMPGASVIFDFVTDLAAAVTALTENTDITPATMGDSQVTVTLAEYGNGVQTTARLQGVSYLPVDPIMAELIGYNMAESVDLLALTELMNGTNVRLQDAVAARVNIAPANVLTADSIRFVVAKLRGASAMPFDGTTYVGMIHPDVSYDLRRATGTASWRDAQVYTDANVNKVWNAYIGTFESVRFQETPRVFGPNPTYGTVPAAVNGANLGTAGTTDVYGTHILGQQAMAKAFSQHQDWGANPRMVVAPVTDFLRRKAGVGWKYLAGWKMFRQACAYRIESASSIGV